MEQYFGMAGRRPCNACRLRTCNEKDCARWQVWFLEAWTQANRYAWAQMDALGRQEPKNFQYELPHMCKSPCESCKCRDWCDTPCSARLKWWDARVGGLRTRMGV